MRWEHKKEGHMLGRPKHQQESEDSDEQRFKDDGNTVAEDEEE